MLHPTHFVTTFKRVSISLILILVFLIPNYSQVQASPQDSSPTSLNKALRFNSNTQAALNTRLGAFQQTRLIASGAAPLDEFGWSVAISGYTAVVGARNSDPDLGSGPISNAGAAYVFVRSGTDWIEEARLTAKDAKTGDTFGVSVAIDGNTIVIGATGCDIGNATDAGAAYVFSRTGITWTQTGKLTSSDATKDDNFGGSIAIDGSTVVVGADGEDVGGYLVDSGAAYVFILRSGEWSQKARLIATDPVVMDYFGTSVAISGSRIVVGATQASLSRNPGAGKAYIYEGSGNNWLPITKLIAEENRNGDYFGSAVAISGNTIVVGAPFSDPNLGDGRVISAGASYVFTLQGGKWSQQAMLVADTANPFDLFGQSVAVDGDRLLIGASGATQAGYREAGAAYLFVRDGKEWTQQTRITGDFVYENDNFGQSVSISGNYVIAGASGMDPGLLLQAGEAFVFQLGLVALPETGFAPGKLTRLAVQPTSKTYQSLGDLWLDIPGLGVESPIIGVPQGNDGWDVSWLWEQVGYLEGTAFPTWSGNTGLVGHAYLPTGEPGPFANLNQVKIGDYVIIHAWGQKYTYQVRSITEVRPSRLDVLNHEDKSWLTLITCNDYNAKTDQFQRRLVVRAILVGYE